jgi:hypothetical protein
MPAASSERPLAEPNKIERKVPELTNSFEIVMEFPNPNGKLKDGMTGTGAFLREALPSGVVGATCRLSMGRRPPLVTAFSALRW